MYNRGMDDSDAVLLEAIVERVVETAAPEQVILFGSRARGDAHRDSDFDLLIIKDGTYHKRELASLVHRHFRGVPASVDLVFVTPEEAARARNQFWTVVHPAMKEGIVVYGRAAA